LIFPSHPVGARTFVVSGIVTDTFGIAVVVSVIGSPAVPDESITAIPTVTEMPPPTSWGGVRSTRVVVPSVEYQAKVAMSCVPVPVVMVPPLVTVATVSDVSSVEVTVVVPVGGAGSSGGGGAAGTMVNTPGTAVNV
jgi:hypothetical protein